MPKSGCPEAHGFFWEKGWWTHDTENSGNENKIINGSHLAGNFSNGKILRVT